MNDLNKNSSAETVHLIKRVALRATLFLCICLIALVGWIAIYGLSTGPQMESDAVVVDIPQGTSLRGISGILGDAGVIEDDVRFLILAKWRGVAGQLKAGEFKVPTGKTPLEILDILVHARPVQHAVTVPEGLRAQEIAEIFAEEGWCDVDKFMSLVHDEGLIKRLELGTIDSLEGYLFPDTYFLTKDVRSAEFIVNMMVKRFHDVWQSLTREMSVAPEMHETVILASIVEKETGEPTERPLIASVFQNRLRKGMRLQSDPTVTYTIENFSGPITRKMLREPTPYNTYVIPGLPAGPIANPGKGALEAVLFPATSNYLYFVSKNDGSHYFSTNLREHNRAVWKYLRKNTNKSGKE